MCHHTLSCSVPSLIATTHSKSKVPPPKPSHEHLLPTPPPSQIDNPPAVAPQWPEEFDTLHPLNISRTHFAQCQRNDPWLGPLFEYLVSNQDTAILRDLPVPDKTDTTAANALFNDIFLLLGFPSVLQSDRGGEWLNPISTGGGGCFPPPAQ